MKTDIIIFIGIMVFPREHVHFIFTLCVHRPGRKAVLGIRTTH